MHFWESLVKFGAQNFMFPSFLGRGYLIIASLLAFQSFKSVNAILAYFVLDDVRLQSISAATDVERF